MDSPIAMIVPVDMSTAMDVGRALARVFHQPMQPRTQADETGGPQAQGANRTEEQEGPDDVCSDFDHGPPPR